MKVVANFALSADGKIGPPDRSHLTLGTPEDWRRMQLLRRAADAVIVGAATFRAAPFALVEDPRMLSDPTTRKTPMWNVILSRSLKLPVDAPAFKDPRVKVLVVTRSGATRPAFPASVEVLELADPTPQAVLEELGRRSAHSVLLESGGDVTAQFFHAWVVDELFLTLSPVILGGANAPTPVGGKAFAFEKAPRLALLEATVRGGEVFLHYRIER